MFALRCTQKLLARLNAKPASIPRTPTTRLGDWYANLVVRRPVHLVVAVSERTLLPVIIEAAPGGTVMPRLGAAVSDVLRRIGIREDAVAAEYGAMRDVVFAKTESKRVLGSLTEFVGMLGFYLEDGDTNLIDISVQLADTPCSPIAYESPKARTVALFESRDPTKME